jgi:hypothetical protein
MLTMRRLKRKRANVSLNEIKQNWNSSSSFSIGVIDFNFSIDADPPCHLNTWIEVFEKTHLFHHSIWSCGFAVLCNPEGHDGIFFPSTSFVLASKEKKKKGRDSSKGTSWEFPRALFSMSFLRKYSPFFRTRKSICRRRSLPFAVHQLTDTLWSEQCYTVLYLDSLSSYVYS